MNIYFIDLHWHLDNWKDEKSPSLEAIAFKRMDDNTWDVYFNEFESQGEIKEIFGENDLKTDEIFGVLIFNSPEDQVEQRFRDWVDNVLLPLRKRKI